MKPKAPAIGATIAAISAAAIAVYALAGPSLNPPAGPVAESGRFGLGTALSDANTPGDASAHYRITQPGMYYLTGNLVTSASTAAIEVTADHVVLDLGGFEISSTNGFDGFPQTQHGILANTTNCQIRNGTIRNFRVAGVNASLGVATRVENVHAASMQSMSGMFTIGTGLSLGKGSSAVHCTVADNLNIGMRVEEGSSVVECVVYRNGNVGIVAIDSLVAHCSVLGHSDNIDIGATGSTLVGNHAP